MEPRQESAVSFLSVGDEAVMHAECPICLEDLCNPDLAPVCVLAGPRGHRVCRHFYHLRCAAELRGIDGRGYGEHVEVFSVDGAEANCPMCRVPFSRAVPLPNPFRDLDTWFNLVDMSEEGCLSKTELIDVVSATLAIDQAKAPHLIEKYWRSWDVNGTDTITPDEIGNLLPFLKKYLPKRARPDPPFLPEAPDEWFDYWDEDENGSLSMAEVTRAVAKTLGAPPDRACELVDGLWCLFDFSGSNSVTKEEFTAKKGLAEMLCAALAQDKSLKRRVTKALKEQPLPLPVYRPVPEASAVSEAEESTVREVDIAMGDRVRDIMTGAVGVVTDVVLDQFVVDYPERRNVRSNAPELHLLSRSGDITTGSRVRIAADVAMPRYGWGLLTRDSIGVVTNILGYRVRVTFPEQQQWYGVLGELELANDDESEGDILVTCPNCTLVNNTTETPICIACGYQLWLSYDSDY